METINDRLKALITELGFSSLNAFDKALGVPRNTTVCYVGEKPSKPGADFLKKIFLEFPDVDARWVLTGEGTMFTPEKQRKSYIENLEKKLEFRDRDATRLETALDMASKNKLNFQCLSKKSPVVKMRRKSTKYFAKIA